MVQSRSNRVREVEYKIIQLGLDPNNLEHAKNLMEEKYKEVIVMKRRIKAPDAYPVQTTELITTTTENEKLEKQLNEVNIKAQKY